MRVGLRWRAAAPLLLSISLFGPTCRAAKPATVPTTWWPDPSTGLMWTGTPGGNYPSGLTWPDANAFCSNLKLGGYTGWRLPSLDEATAVLEPYTETFNTYGSHPPYPVTSSVRASTYEFKFDRDISIPATIWTSTPIDDRYWDVHAWSKNGVLNSTPPPRLLAIFLDNGNVFGTAAPTTHSNHLVLCVRPMEPDLAALSRLAPTAYPVADIATLKAYIPFNRAFRAYEEKRYQESIADLHAALGIQPSFVRAQWALGVLYYLTQQWDQSIASYQAALRLDKNNQDAINGLSWAKYAKKRAAKPDKKLKKYTPVWING